MPNKNCLEGISCPKCGYEAAFKIQATVIATVADDGVEDFGGDTEWGDDDTYIKCCGCGHDGELQDFRAGAGRYNYTFSIMFSLKSDVSLEAFEKSPMAIPEAAFRRAIEQRMRRLDKSPVPEWYEAVGAPDDVVDMEGFNKPVTKKKRKKKNVK